MRVSSRNPLPEALRGAIIALGNFDGFHRGHQAVVGEAIAWAKAEGRPAIVATFDPHPVEFFAAGSAPFRLSSLDQRQEWFAAAGADAMLVFVFDAAMAASSAHDWVHGVLGAQLGAAGVVTGEDFTFGKGRSGTIATLRELGAEVGLRSRAIGPVTDEGEVVSSSRIRRALQAGDMAAATRLLTRPFALRGHVQHGDKVGRTIGFPTANLALGDYLRPAYGIYAVTGRLPDGRVLKGAANIGIRPHFTPPKELLEPHFFDFAGDLYGQDIEIAFHAFLRGEARFESLEALTTQIGHDCDAAREILESV
ncbi:bifunctional riboflavin kinase/FAD synthetase [Novosphingobium sp. FSY-8]|uniref:Riboflavin biosynthesis protein n=1 Tax=Novosphingobium ovatum TaxID=1908523 RepID=A0ABW9XEH4_9SPHN|nr:bifunctional riboflavin kinase/FAD synthetase [Novosphingobium ovatum]